MPPSDYVANYTAVVLAAVAGLGLVAAMLFLAGILAPRQYRPPKDTVYECGMVPMGQFWSQIHVRYYLFAILFVIFDVEVAFLFPWAVVFEGIGAFAYWEMVLFVAILAFGLLYAWRKGVLRWE